MTVSTTNNRVSYAGNGVTTVFSFPNKFLADADLVVLDVLDSTGAETTKTLTTDYTVSGAGDEAGGSVTMLTAPAAGHTLVIYRDPALTQPIDLVNGDPLNVETGIERGLDRATTQIQRVRDLQDRSLHLPDGDTGFTSDDTELPPAVERASKFLAFDNVGALVATAGIAGTVVVSPFMETVVDDATANAALTTLTATRAEAGAAAVPTLTKLREHVTFGDFGAVGDGTTDDTTAVAAALAAGKPIDGVGLTYAVTGNITLPAGANVKDATFKQLAPAGAGNVRTLTSASVDNLVLRHVTVNKNGDGTNGQLSLDAGIWISGGAGHLFEDVTVYGDDMGSGIVLDACSDFKMIRPEVRDINYSLGADPGDDRVQGIWLNGCSNFSMDHPYVHDLGGNYGAGATTKYSRGIVFGGNSDFAVTAPICHDVDQGIDITGSAGNSHFTVTGGHVKDIYTYGFKAANSASDGTFTGCVAETCGYAGFVVSGATEAALPNCEDIMFVGCKAKDIGSNGHWAANATGFLVLQGSFALTYPRGVRFIGCDATDEQGVPTMLWGFRNQIDVSATGHQFNECVNCTVRGAVTADYSGMNYGGARVIRNAVQSIPNATLTEVSWNGTDTYDGAIMHDPASNAGRVYARRSGWYRCYANLSYDTNATGTRWALLYKNGTAIPQATSIVINGGAGGVVTVAVAATVFLIAGDYVSAYAYQNSGGALNLRENESVFEVTAVAGAGT